jgi:hypothetical protein
MLRLSRELISALRLSFEAWPNGKIGRLRNMLSCEFRRGVAEKAVVHASNRVTLVFIFHPRFTNTVAAK